MKILEVLLFVCATGSATHLFAQDNGFAFGNISLADLRMTRYEKDTSANALVLDEFGEGFFNPDTYDLIVNYHVKIKILKQEGLDEANVEIPIRKSEREKDKIMSIKASAFNLVDNRLVESKLDSKEVFTVEEKYYDFKRFAIPNVRVGTVIEYSYQIQTKFIFNFHTWSFQQDIPKVRSEFWAKIPGNYIYNVSVKGPLQLTKQERKIISKCIVISEGAYGAGTNADCMLLKVGMQDIPAFKEEPYMTASSNFISTLEFELSEVKYFDGSTDKVTKEWKDVDGELRAEKRFGGQLKRGGDIMEDHLQPIRKQNFDSLSTAKNIYDFIKDWYQWNGVYGKYSDVGIKQAFEERKGSVGDINLSLIAALDYAGFSVEPMILSTRENGLPKQIFPVLSDFNYVIAKLNINGRTYLLDATDDFLPFGALPVRCLNGQGRVFNKKDSYWFDIKPSEKSKMSTMCSLKLSDDGLLTGDIQRIYQGDQAVRKRKKIVMHSNKEDHIKELGTELPMVSDISELEVSNLNEYHRPLTEKLKIEINDFQGSSSFLLNPFLANRLDDNPFKSQERLYPVDFGVLVDETLIFTLEIPNSYSLEEVPEKIALALPVNGGRYICEYKLQNNLLTVSSVLTLNKTVYSSDEYHYLKELFARIVQAQNIDLIFKRK